MSNNSIVLIVPDALREKANRLACVLGYDTSPLPGASFSRPLSASGSLPVTHWGMHTWATDSFVALMSAAKLGAYPAVDWLACGITNADADDVMAALMDSVKDEDVDPRTNWLDALIANGLQIVPIVVARQS